MEEESGFSVGLQSEDNASGLFFKQVKISESPLLATLRMSWKGTATDGAKEANLDGGKKKNTGEFFLTDSRPDAPFSQAKIDFKNLDLTLKKTTDWKLQANGFQQAKKISGEGSITENVSFVFSFTAKVSRMKR